MDNIATIARPAPFEFVPALLTLLRSMVKQRRHAYKSADFLILCNLEKGERRYGKAKLKLSQAKLVEHMAAVESRRQSGRELQILVPLMHRVVSCSQMRSKTADALTEALNPFRAKLATWACTNGTQGEYEKPLAESLISSFPDLLAPPADAQEPRTTEKPQVDESRLKLYNKITSAGILDGKEIERLRVIFWG